MNDIVEQLRSEKKRVDSFLGSTTATKLCIEAALEIERLRAQNEKLREACATGWGEPALINILKAENAALRAELEAYKTTYENAAAWCDALLEKVSNRDELIRQFEVSTEHLIRERDALLEALRKIRGHTSYQTGCDRALIVGLLMSIERIVDAAIDAARAN